MGDYDALSAEQKKWVCDMARKVYLDCLGQTGKGACHAEAVYLRCGSMPAIMAGMVQGFADCVRDGRMTLESLAHHESPYPASVTRGPRPTRGDGNG
jgi:hypothetical protein